MNQLVRNAMKCPDGTIIESHHRHDYVTHVDKTNGEEYMVDGGLSYLRRSLNAMSAEDLSVDTSYPFEVVREAFRWGTYGKDPDYSEMIRVPLSRLSNSHIEAIIWTQTHLMDSIFNLFTEELIYREEHNIYIEEVEDYETPLEKAERQRKNDELLIALGEDVVYHGQR